ncbi:hypothetical protein PHLCEN_2v13066 [Hermanssonia centrifuga]|uniref:Glycosyltransferase family 69 protein n=1 Tax=Hermanssonia centrifuga TaxID=98765 RepID=A0A2R6NFC8_9APHY|nr:hypothetical protein PHLCEN_2v13066 [Hermanssonia centrifuga]
MPKVSAANFIFHARWILLRGGRLALSVALLPGAVQVICLVVLYYFAAKIWCGKYCGVWEPAFPKAWTAFVLFLSIIPIFALLQLIWLLGVKAVVYFMDRRQGSRYQHANGSSGRGSIVFDSEEAQYMLLREGEGEDGPRTARPPSPTQASPRHKLWSRIPSIYKLLWWAQITLYSVLLFVGAWEVSHYENEGDIRYRPVLQKALAHKSRDPAGYAKGEKIYFAAAFYNNQDVLPYWSQTLLDVIAYLGTNNVFVSIVENNSDDHTADLLHELDNSLANLDVQRRILIGDQAVKKPDDMGWNNRIDFLSAIRNRALEPLVEHGGYDKVVFSNDIFIEPESLIELLETNDGQYDMACALDFGHFGAYDMWVLRDRVGRLAAGIWPYFFDMADYQAMKTESAVPVMTCWNGIVVFTADPVLPVHLRSNRTLSTEPLRRQPPSTHPLANTLAQSPALTPPLSFRSSPRGEGCFSSESFLLPYDMRRIMGLDRIYVNPRVITAYVWHFYVWHKWVLRQRIVKWFVELYDGAWMQYARMIVGDDDKVYTWDGIDCHPWWYGDWW